MTINNGRKEEVLNFEWESGSHGCDVNVQEVKLKLALWNIMGMWDEFGIKSGKLGEFLYQDITS